VLSFAPSEPGLCTGGASPRNSLAPHPKFTAK
jgi:hypothetical protein